MSKLDMNQLAEQIKLAAVNVTTSIESDNIFEVEEFTNFLQEFLEEFKKLSAEDAAPYQIILDECYKNITDWTQVLIEDQQRIKDELSSLDKHKQAFEAYS